MKSQTLVNQLWENESNYPDTVEWSASELVSNNLYSTGNTWHSFTEHTNIVTTKTNSGGSIVWQTEYNGTPSGWDYGAALAVDGSGNVYIAGATHNSDSYTFDVVVIKYNLSGVQQWATTYDGTGSDNDIPSAILINGSNIYVCAASIGTTTGYDYVTMKLTTSGTISWTSRYDYTGLYDIPGHLAMQSTNVVVTGASQSSATNWDYTAVKYNSSGTQINLVRSSAAGYGFDRPTGLVTDAADNLYITGYTFNGTDYDMRTIKLDDDISPIWTVTEDSGYYDGANGIAIDNSNNIYICGFMENSSGSKEMTVIKYNSSGTRQWIQILPNRDNTIDGEATGIVYNSSSATVIVTGYYSYTTGAKEIITFALQAADGDLDWFKEYPNLNASIDVPTRVHTNNNNIWVFGRRTVDDTTRYVSIKYEILERDFEIVDDTVNNIRYLDHQIIIAFNPDLVDLDFVNDRQKTFDDLENIIPDSVYETILPLIEGEGQFTPVAIKVFKKLIVGDSISITRLGKSVRIPDFWSTLVVTTNVDPMELLDTLNKLQSFIIFAEPNFVYDLFYLPDDIQSEQESLYNPVDVDEDINIENAWSIEKGRDHVKVGISDTGIYWKHEDFGNGTSNGSAVTAGYDYEHGYAYFYDTNDDEHSGYHGTAVAGIVGAISDNTTGIAGIAGGDGVVGGSYWDGTPGVQLVDLEIGFEGYYEPDGGGILLEYAVDAIFEAAADVTDDYGFGVNMINCSWGGPASLILERSIGFAFTNQVALICAKGNDETDKNVYPADFDDVQVICVGGSGTGGGYEEADPLVTDDGANFGEHLDLIAPYGYKTAIYTTDNGDINDYSYFSETSASTPHVTGVASLMASYVNNTDGLPHLENIAPEDQENILQLGATDKTLEPCEENYDTYCGWGLLNAEGSFSLIEKPHYKVEHFCHDYYGPGDMVLDESDLIVELDAWTYLSNGLAIAPGVYVADRYVIDETLYHILSPSTVIIDSWKLQSMSDVLLPSFPEDLQIDYDFGIPSTSSVDVVAYAYHLKERTYGGITEEISKWLPTLDAPIQICYTLLTYNSEATTTEESFADNNLKILSYPNPSASTATLYFQFIEFNDNDEVLIEIADISGMSVFEGPYMIDSNTHSINLDLQSLSPGLYVITISSSGFNSVVRQIKI